TRPRDARPRPIRVPGRGGHQAGSRRGVDRRSDPRGPATTSGGAKALLEGGVPADPCGGDGHASVAPAVRVDGALGKGALTPPHPRIGRPRRLRARGPNGVRTRVSTLRGWCPGPLDDGTDDEATIAEHPFSLVAANEPVPFPTEYHQRTIPVSVGSAKLNQRRGEESQQIL